VDYAAADGTAANGLEYSLSPGTLFFQAGQTSLKIPYTVKRAGNLDTTFTVSLTNPRNTFGALPLPTLGSRTTETITISNP
jgi:hypothetical protein